MVFTTGRFILSLALLFVLVFFCPLALGSLRLGREKKRESWYTYVLLVHLFVYFARVNLCPSSVSLVAFCDCGTPWIFLLTFF